MTSFAVVLQVWDLSRSSLAVGLLGLTFVPMLVVGLLGGSAADAVDRRKLALVASACLMAVSAAFAAQAYAGLGLLWRCSRRLTRRTSAARRSPWGCSTRLSASAGCCRPRC